MKFRSTRGASWAMSCLLALTALSSGCVSMYVDNALKDVSPAQVARPAEPHPVQLLFTFQTKGVNNTRATDALKKQVREAVEASGLFAAVGTDPAAGGAIVDIRLDNVPITSEQEAMAKGFGTGLTFGLVGSSVTDGYVCTVDYLPPGATQRLTATARHAIHATVGAKGAPANGIKARSAAEAVDTMTRQVVISALVALSKDPGFR
jgi:hypothetical protein